MKFLSWNLLGLASPSKRAVIKNVISSYKPDFIILSKTKLCYIKQKVIRSIWNNKSVKWVAKYLNRKSGGILLMWDELRYKVVGTLEGSFTIFANILGSNGASRWIQDGDENTSFFHRACTTKQKKKELHC